MFFKLAHEIASDNEREITQLKLELAKCLSTQESLTSQVEDQTNRSMRNTLTYSGELKKMAKKIGKPLKKSYLICPNNVGPNFRRPNFSSALIFVISRNFRHLRPTNNLVRTKNLGLFQFFIRI